MGACVLKKAWIRNRKITTCNCVRRKQSGMLVTHVYNDFTELHFLSIKKSKSAFVCISNLLWLSRVPWEKKKNHIRYLFNNRETEVLCKTLHTVKPYTRSFLICRWLQKIFIRTEETPSQWTSTLTAAHLTQYSSAYVKIKLWEFLRICMYSFCSFRVMSE